MHDRRLFRRQPDRRHGQLQLSRTAGARARRWPDFRFLNHGVNGDLAWNGLQRLDRVIAERPDFVTILIGTNDVNATLSERNLLRYHAFNHLPVRSRP